MQRASDDYDAQIARALEDWTSMRDRWTEATARCQDLERENEALRRRVRELEDMDDGR